jgi:hypothetical protein
VPTSPTSARKCSATSASSWLALVRGFQDTSAALASLSDGEAARTVERLRETLAAHYSDERGVVLDSRLWLITGQRRR